MARNGLLCADVPLRNYSINQSFVLEIWRESQNKNWELLISPDAPSGQIFTYNNFIQLYSSTLIKYSAAVNACLIDNVPCIEESRLESVLTNFVHSFNFFAANVSEMDHLLQPYTNVRQSFTTVIQLISRQTCTNAISNSFLVSNHVQLLAHIDKRTCFDKCTVKYKTYSKLTN